MRYLILTAAESKQLYRDVLFVAFMQGAAVTYIPCVVLGGASPADTLPHQTDSALLHGRSIP